MEHDRHRSNSFSIRADFPRRGASQDTAEKLTLGYLPCLQGEDLANEASIQFALAWDALPCVNGHKEKSLPAPFAYRPSQDYHTYIAQCTTNFHEPYRDQVPESSGLDFKTCLLTYGYRYDAK